jgi:hypothetical protein
VSLKDRRWTNDSVQFVNGPFKGQQGKRELDR